MRPFVLRAAFAGLGGLGLACMNTEFLEGIRCTRDDDCGRSFACEGGVCGGCSEDARGPDGRCECPGNRILECGVVEGDDPCVAVCTSALELCGVAVRGPDGHHEEITPCSDPSPTATCFRIELDAGACEPGEAEIRIEPAPPIPPVLLVNCPPPQSDDGRFDCP